MSKGGQPGKAAAGGGKLGGVFKDKRVLYGAAAAGVLGLVVLMKKGNGDVSAGGDDSGGGGSTIQPAQFDSTGTDVYNAIQSIGQGWNQDLRDFTDQLGDIQDQLDKLGQAPPVTKPTTPAPKPKPKPTPKPAPKPKPKPAPAKKVYETVSAWKKNGAPWDSTLSGIAKHYKTTVSNLYKLNPNLHGKSTIHPNQKIRVK